MGSISPDSGGAKRSRLKVGPQLLRLRVCDSLLVLAWQVSFWSASHQRAACKQKYRYSRYIRVGDRCFSIKTASDSGSPLVEHYWIRSDHVLCTWDKNEKDDFGDDDKRNPTKLCLASASLHQHRSPAAVLPWLWRKQQIRDKGKRETGHVVWQSSYMQLLLWISGCSYERAVLAPLPGELEPVSSVAKRLDIDFLHGAKHFGGYSNLRTNFIYFQRAGVIFHQTMFHFRRLHVFMIEIILSFIRQAGFHLLPSRYHFSSNNIWEYQLKVAEAISEDCTFQWSKVFYLSSTLALHPTIQPSNQTSMSSSQARSSVWTAAQLGRSIKVGGSQSNLRNQRNAALKTPWRSQGVAKNHLGKAQSQMWGKKWRADDLPFDFTKQHHFLSG